MKQYTQLSQEERYNISAAVKSNTPKAELAREMNRHRSTIYREIQCSKGQCGYRSKQAHELAQQCCYRKTSGCSVCPCLYLHHKGALFEHGTQEQIQAIEDRLKHRPRKSLGWQTSSEVRAGFFTVALAA